MVPVPTIAMRRTAFCETILLLPYFGWLSAAVPDGRASFGECVRAFARVLAAQQAGCDLVLALERISVIESLCFSQDPLDGRQRKRCIVGDALSKLLRSLQCGPRRGQLTD